MEGRDRQAIDTVTFLVINAASAWQTTSIRAIAIRYPPLRGANQHLNKPLEEAHRSGRDTVRWKV